MRFAVGKIHDDFVGPGIDLEGDTSFTRNLLLGEGIIVGFGNGQLQIGDLGGGEIGAARDFPDESA